MKERGYNPSQFEAGISTNQTETTLPENGVVFDAKKLKDLRHNKNLHGEGRYLDGLTGFYHRKYYRNGRYEPNRKRD